DYMKGEVGIYTFNRYYFEIKDPKTPWKPKLVSAKMASMPHNDFTYFHNPKMVKKILEESGLKKVIVQTSIGHIGP
ncbi:MAG: hypothetical protein QW723_04745, partial [Candidatus Bathyarchaeia archaeon]